MHVFSCRQGAEQLEPLKGPPQSQTRADMRLRLRHVGGAEMDTPLGGLLETRDHIEKGGLSGAVGTDQPVNLSGRHPQRH